MSLLLKINNLVEGEIIKRPSKYIKSKGELESTKTVLKMLYSSDILGERAANFLARIVPETNFNALDAGQAAERDATYQEYGEKEAYSPHDSYLKYRLFGGKKSLLEYDNMSCSNQHLLLLL